MYETWFFEQETWIFAKIGKRGRFFVESASDVFPIYKSIFRLDLSVFHRLQKLLIREKLSKLVENVFFSRKNFHSSKK